MTSKTWRVALATLMGLPLIAGAQTNPVDPAAAAPQLAYSSAFADYKPWQDIKPAEWRAVNDTVRDAKPEGGHAGHGSGGSAAPSQAAPGPAASAPPAQATPAARPPGSHSGHGAHK